MFGIPTYKNNMDIKRVVFVSGRMPYYIMPRDHLCENIVGNLHSSTDNKIDDSKDSFWEEVEQIFAFTWCYSRKFYDVKKSDCEEHNLSTLKHSEMYLDLFWPGDS